MKVAEQSKVLSQAGASALKSSQTSVAKADVAKVKVDDGNGSGLSGEEENGNENRKLVADALASMDHENGQGTNVDKLMLEGRKSNRGFTVCVGSNNPAEFRASLRKDNRAMTMPAGGMRRGDFVLTEEALAQLVENNRQMQARKRRGSVSMMFTVVPQKELSATWTQECTCHCHGSMTDGQAFGDEREWWFSTESKKLPGQLPPIIQCQKGSKGFRDTTPNQDNFSITYFKNGYTLACAFDGHGPFGHIVSHRTVQTVPFFLAHSEHFLATKPDMSAALIEAFEKSQADVVGHALENDWDVQASGSTAVAALWKGNVVWTANCGDSRCVVGTEMDRKVVFETEDHKPNSEKEKSRIERAGGEVRSKTYSDGWVNHRIFVKGKSYPGLCMARTLGDESVKAHGVIATPEVVETKMDLDKKPFILLASDGVWEFMDSPFVVKAMARKIAMDGPKVSVQKLQREAQKRWREEEGDYCDDITSILIQVR